jgi:hypothetical protein
MHNVTCGLVLVDQLAQVLELLNVQGLDPMRDVDGGQMQGLLYEGFMYYKCLKYIVLLVMSLMTLQSEGWMLGVNVMMGVSSKLKYTDLLSHNG